MSNHSKDGKFDRPQMGIYHPYEFFFSGFSNSGKTTLMSKVVAKLSSEYDVACVKHCSHRYNFDREGKDSWHFTKAGAQHVMLNAPGKWATHTQADFAKFDFSEQLRNADFVLAEGAKEQSGDKILVLDKDLKILQALEDGELTEVKALTGESKPEKDFGLPFFHRDDVDAISEFVLENLKSKTPDMKALLLTGGKSSRMGKDKAYLEYAGKPQLNRANDLLKSKVSDVRISCKNRGDYPGFEQDVYLEDRFDGLGPLGGSLTAISEDAKSAWLVMAVDLPLVDEDALNHLLENRNPFKTATAFRSNFKDFPEPLFTIYEPQARHNIFKFMGLGYSCPRKVLINSPVETLEQQNPRWLDNANTPEEYEEICQVLENGN
ncbi:MAG: molybdopterin-guanine dinucleotide biosynthesis protein B [Lentisphaerales bacterium]|nr:molybdopterin-guanine dinucleotide biosynthesis protein B [Lentisphaerales bacterium]